MLLTDVSDKSTGSVGGKESPHYVTFLTEKLSLEIKEMNSK